MVEELDVQARDVERKTRKRSGRYSNKTWVRRKGNLKHVAFQTTSGFGRTKGPPHKTQQRLVVAAEKLMIHLWGRKSVKISGMVGLSRTNKNDDRDLRFRLWLFLSKKKKRVRLRMHALKLAINIFSL